MNDFQLLSHIAEVFSQEHIGNRIGHPREVINRWLKEKSRAGSEEWLTYNERIALEGMLPQEEGNKEYDFTFIDLFAGIGGIRRGFDKANGNCVFTSEWDKYSVRTYRANYYSGHEIVGDITAITQPKGFSKKRAYENIKKVIPDHDVLLAGFPCQPFSIAGVSKKKSLGRSHGFEDETQGTLFFDVARIIDAKKPLAVMLENVKNLKSHDRGKTFKVIINTLEELGYEVVDQKEQRKGKDPRIINGKHFVPQNRERIVIIAFRKDVDAMRGLTLKKIENYYPVIEPRVGDILESEKVDNKYTLSSKLWKYLKDYAAKHKKAGNGFGYGKVTREDRSTRTLSARYYKDGSEVLVDQGKRKRPRRLTPRECARLMGFDKPNESKFVIPVSDTQAYKQFGNSVVVPVFEAVADLMKPHIMRAKRRELTNKSKRKVKKVKKAA